MDQLSPDIRVEDISLYYDEMLQSNLAELEVETPHGKIVLKRVQSRKDSSPTSSSGQAYRRRKTDHEINEGPLPTALKAVTSPIMGIFYQSSSPQSVPFAKEGETVNAGSTLCIVEAMKVMNEIKADSRCKIVRILAENGKPVTKGQPLFHVEPL